MARRTLTITYLATYLLAFSGIFRIVLGYYRSAEFPPIALCLGVYLVLLLAEPLVFRQNRIRSIIYLKLRSGEWRGPRLARGRSRP